jgi:uncharacterized protein (DUF924 family)
MNKIDTTKMPSDTMLQTIIDYWFGDIALNKPFDIQSVQMQRWYGKDGKIDAEIRERYEPTFHVLSTHETKGSFHKRNALQQLAVIICLDQFPRNMYRDTANMYQSDEKALELCEVLVASTGFSTLDAFKRMFATLPMMHAEELDAQRKMLEIFKGFVIEAELQNSPNVDFFRNALNFAQRHYDIIDMFGRFPHRNEILGRQSSKAELRFLETPDSSF